MKLEEIKREYEVSILDGMARTLWVMAYADFAEKNGRCVHCGDTISLEEDRLWAGENTGNACPDNDDGHERDDEFWPVARNGGDWDKVALPTPAVAYTCATAICKRIVELEAMSMADLFELAMQIDQGEFEWFEEEWRPGKGKTRDSLALREERDEKHEAAVELGSGLAHEVLGSGVAWGDNRKTHRAGAIFDPKIPRGEFSIMDFDFVQWSVEGGARGTDSVTRNISIGSTVPEPNQRYMGDEEFEIETDDIGATIAEQTVNVMTVEIAGDALEANGIEPSSDVYVDGVFYRTLSNLEPMSQFSFTGPSRSATRRSINMVLNGFFSYEREWIYYLVTKRIGRIHVIEEPYNGDYEERRYGSVNDFDTNILLWFGTSSPKLILCFGNSLESALSKAVDFIEEQGWLGLFDDEVVNERFDELVRAECEKRGLPDPDMISDRVRDRIREESEIDTVTAGNADHYLNVAEFGEYGKNLSLDELRRIGMEGYFPKRTLELAFDENPARQESAPVKVTNIPIVTRTSAAPRNRR